MTAVEWLFIELYEKFEMKGDGREMDKVLEQAKAMEKEQIMMAFNDGKVNSVLNKRNSEQYYKKTYLNDTGSR